MDNVDYGYNISCGKHKNRTGICTRVADSVDKLWKIKNPCTADPAMHIPGNRVRAAFFQKKTVKIIDFRVDETGVYEYN